MKIAFNTSSIFKGEIILTSLFFLLLYTGLHAQDPEAIRAIDQKLSSAKEDSARSRIYYDASRLYLAAGEISKADSCADLAIEYADKSGSPIHMSSAHRVKGTSLDYSGRYNDAIDEYNLGISIIDTSKFRDEYSAHLLAIANALFFKASYDDALNYYYRSLYVRRAIGDSAGMAGSMMGIANVYSANEQDAYAVPFYKEALGIQERRNNKKMISWLLNNLGSTYVDAGKPDSALPYFERSIKMKEEEGDMYGLSATYINVGEIYLLKDDPNAALFYFRKAYDIRKEMGDSHELANTYQSLGKAYERLGKYDTAMMWFDSSYAMAIRSEMKDVQYRALYLMAELKYNSGNHKEAFDYLLKSVNIKDSVITEESRQQINELMQRFDTEQKEQKIALQNAEIESGKTFRNFLYVIIGLSIILGIVLLFGFIRKQKTNQLLAAKNEVIEQQNKIVEEKNKDIIDSITYAKRIQTALLPSDTKFKRLLPESFVFYQPRDIVSGDCYMIEEWGNEIIVAAVDCTGHGVPGAFMSFMAYDLFQEAVMEHGITSPGAILSRMRAGVTRMLVQGSESKQQVYDGMDAAICTISADGKRVTYAGAHRPLWLIRNGEFIEYKETKCSVSPAEHDQIPFNVHEIETRPGDLFYIFSDGYADQFGGPNGKKFKLARLKQLLLDFRTVPSSAQEEKVAAAFRDWKGKMEQIDDVLLIGFRIR